MHEIGLDDDRRANGRGSGRMAAVWDAQIALHKEQFGRGPRRTRSHFADEDRLVCICEDALSSADLALVEMTYHGRVQQTQLSSQMATRSKFIEAVQAILERKVIAFSSATDGLAGVVWEIYLEPRSPR